MKRFQLFNMYNQLILVCLFTVVSATTKITPSTPRMTVNTRTTYYPFLTTTSRGTRYSYYYMDNSRGQCSSYGSNYLTSRNSVAYVKAWYSFSRRPQIDLCELTFVSYSAYDLKYRFDPTSYNHITDCSVTLNIYDGSSTFGRLLGSYSCFNNIPTTYKYVSSGRITIELKNYGSKTNFDFSISVTSSGGGGSDVGLIIGLCTGLPILCFIIFICICGCRRRRYRRRNRLITGTATIVTAPPSTPNYGTVYPSPYPPPPPVNNQEYSTAPPPYTPGYQYSAGVVPPPAGAAPPLAAGYTPPPAGAAPPPAGYIPTPAGAVTNQPPPPAGYVPTPAGAVTNQPPPPTKY